MFTTIVIWVGIAVISYLIGAIPFGYVIGRLYGHDLLKEGSCNIGATNVTRVVGNIPGKICFVLDMAKGAFPVFMVIAAIKSGQLDYSYYDATIIAAVAAVLGHIFPVYLKFKGGKGVATAAGAVLGLTPYAILIALVIWAIVFLSTRYVSVASIVAAICVPAIAFLLSYFHIWPMSNWALIFLSLLALLAIARHYANIKRLLKGEENRFGKRVSKIKDNAEEK